MKSGQLQALPSQSRIIKQVLEPKGRARLDNRYPVTVSPVSPNDALKYASLVGTNTKCKTQYCLIVQGVEKK